MAPYMSEPSSRDDAQTAANDVNPSGIRVIIVGAGFAGITAAIECTRKGHSCLILESYKSTNGENHRGTPGYNVVGDENTG
jgi:succinate dehydrogenase/fumarate reductase flavoprotein subunit